jgi:Anti-sigma-K factor rskA
VNEDHEAVQEVLAAHALRALDEADQGRAEELLASHLPACAECRDALQAFEAVAADLALAPAPRTPPELLEHRLRREIDSRGRPRWLPRVAAAVAVAALAVVGAWNVHLVGRVSHAEDREASTTEMLATLSHPKSRLVPLAAEQVDRAIGSVAVAYVPGQPHLYLFGSLPKPGSNRTYQLWMGQGNRFESKAIFVPDRGVVVLRILVDPRGYDRVLITEEPLAGSRTPSGPHVVTASF